MSDPPSVKDIKATDVRTQLKEILEGIESGTSYRIVFGHDKKPVAMIVPIEEAT